MTKQFPILVFAVLLPVTGFWLGSEPVCGQQDAENSVYPELRTMQREAIESKQADWAHWGSKPEKYSGWTNHSNRLVPVYTFGIGLDSVAGTNSVYRDEQRLAALYRRQPEHTLNPTAEYFDQTDIYHLQREAVAAGKKHVILIIFDGLDWPMTRAAAIYRSRADAYAEGRGQGLAFQDYDKVPTGFGYMVCSPWSNGIKKDVNAQLVTRNERPLYGGYNPQLGGDHPWSEPASYPYLISQDRGWSHAYTDSAASASSMTSGIKTYNGSVNVAADGQFVVPLARNLQDQGFSIGVVTSVPVSHATPAAAYANNVTRNDYQDLSRNLLGLPSVAHRTPLPGVDVLLGCGWGNEKTSESEVKSEIKKQGTNFVPGNRYITRLAMEQVNEQNGGQYVVVTRTPEKNGRELLNDAVTRAVAGRKRLLGFFGCEDDHLPFATADGHYDPVRGVGGAEVYEPCDIDENPTLADMTVAALQVLEQNETGFWLMIEPGDVDWASHDNNVDNSIGAIFSGEAAFEEVCRWAEAGNHWDDTAIIVTADHGHLFVLDRPESLIPGNNKKSHAGPD